MTPNIDCYRVGAVPQENLPFQGFKDLYQDFLKRLKPQDSSDPVTNPDDKMFGFRDPKQAKVCGLRV